MLATCCKTVCLQSIALFREVVRLDPTRSTTKVDFQSIFRLRFRLRIQAMIETNQKALIPDWQALLALVEDAANGRLAASTPTIH